MTMNKMNIRGSLKIPLVVKKIKGIFSWYGHVTRREKICNFRNRKLNWKNGVGDKVGQSRPKRDGSIVWKMTWWNAADQISYAKIAEPGIEYCTYFKKLGICEKKERDLVV